MAPPPQTAIDQYPVIPSSPVIPLFEFQDFVLRLVETYLEAHISEPVYLTDHCAATGASERTLQQVFRQSYGVSPLHYLKVRRLNLARQCLRGGISERPRITDVALGRGFWELGRFAVDYKAVFGELPSHTLQRRNSWGHSNPRTVENDWPKRP